MTDSSNVPNGFRSFKFSSSNAPLEWDKLVALDIDRIISTRDVKTLISKLDIVIKCNIDTEIKRMGFGELFVKLFRLSQLGIEYLLHCKAFLENNLTQTEMEVDILKQEISSHKQTCIRQPKKRKACVVLAAAVEHASFKCTVCRKIFVSDYHLKHHLSRHHMRRRSGFLPNGQTPEEIGSIAEKNRTTSPTPNNNGNNVIFYDKTKTAVMDAKGSQENFLQHIDNLSSPHAGQSLNWPSNVAIRLEELITTMDCRGTLTNNKNPVDSVKSNDSSAVLSDCLAHITYSPLDKSLGETVRSGLRANQEVLGCHPNDEADLQKIREDVNSVSDTQHRVGSSVIVGVDEHGVSMDIKFSRMTDNDKPYDSLYDEEYTSTMTESETTSSSDEIDYTRIREEIEHELEIKLRSLGIDPEWQKLSDAAAKSNTAVLSEIRKTYAHGDQNYYAIRDKLKLEVEKQAHILVNRIESDLSHIQRSS